MAARRSSRREPASRRPFTGYETSSSTRRSARPAPSRTGARSSSSPSRRSTPTGGGQVPDGGVIECEDGDCRARVVDVVRAGDDQALVLEPVDGELQAGERVVARVDRARAPRHRGQPHRHAPAARRAARAPRHRTCARRAPTSGPTSCASTSPTAQRLSEEERRDVEDRVNEWILRQPPGARAHDDARRGPAASARWRCSARSTATSCGWSRSATAAARASCAAAPTCAPPPRSALFKITTETSSAANVRRIEAVTGPEAVGLLRRHDDLLREAADALRTQPERLPEAVAALRAEARAAAKAGAAVEGPDAADARRARRAGRRRRRAGRGRRGARRQGAHGPRRPRQGQARRPRRDRARHRGRRPRAPRRRGHARRWSSAA